MRTTSKNPNTPSRPQRVLVPLRQAPAALRRGVEARDTGISLWLPEAAPDWAAPSLVSTAGQATTVVLLDPRVSVA